jgi:Uncharacterised protein conserved in bacteria (DUF2336)
MTDMTAPAFGSSTASAGTEAEVVEQLLDIMARPPAASQPNERAMAADILCRLVPRLPIPLVKAICDRVALMREPPAPLLSCLLAHAETALTAPLIEGSAIGELELKRIVATGDPNNLRLIARRRVLPQGLVARLVASGDGQVLLTLLRNPGAAMSFEVLEKLADAARADPVLMAPLMTRAETPPSIAFDLFLDLPPELRRYVLSRYLADSAAIGRMIAIAAVIDGESDVAPSKENIAPVVEALLISAGDAAARLLSRAAGVAIETARRILADKGGELLTIALKAAGMTRREFAAGLDRLKGAGATVLPQDRDIAELHRLFDSLSYNKAKVLLTYWNWRFGRSTSSSGTT